MKQITGKEQVFPVAVPGHQYSDGSSETPYAKEGMTLNQYAFIHAPAQIPKWFKHIAPSKFGLAKKPIIDDFTFESEEDKELAKKWSWDPCWDLDGSLKTFQDEWNKKVDKWFEESEDWEYRNNAARFFQWRMFFVQEMITSMNNLDTTVSHLDLINQKSEI